MVKRIIISLVLLFVMVVGFVSPAKAATYKTITLDLNSYCLAWYNGNAWQFKTGSELAAVPAVQAGYHSASYQKMQSGLRYVNLPINRGAEISSAYLSFTAYDNMNKGEVVNTGIKAAALSGSYAFSDYDDFDDRQWLNGIEWDDISPWTVGNSYKSPDIFGLIQDAVDQSGWVNGADLVLYWGDGNGESTESNGVVRRACATGAKSVKLVITYDNSSIPVADYDDVLGELADIKARFGNLTDANQSLASDVNALQSQIAQMLAEVQALPNRVGTNSGRVDELVSTSNSLATQLAQLQKEFQEYQSSNAELKTMIQATASKVNNVQTDIDGIIEMVGKYEGENDSIAKSIGMLRILVILCLLLVGVNLTVLYLIYRRGK